MKNVMKFFFAIVFSLAMMVPATAATTVLNSQEITVVDSKEKDKKDKKECAEKKECDKKKEKECCDKKKECDKKDKK